MFAWDTQKILFNENRCYVIRLKRSGNMPKRCCIFYLSLPPRKNSAMQIVLVWHNNYDLYAVAHKVFGVQNIWMAAVSTTFNIRFNDSRNLLFGSNVSKAQHL